MISHDFDAVKFKFEIAYDPVEDRVVGPHGEGNLCLMTGILEDYESRCLVSPNSI